jgi:hypothetical protein
MSTFFLIVEIFSYVFALFLFIKKKELAIIYIPVLIFANNIIVPVFSAFIYYATISVLIISVSIKNGSFFRNNIYALLLCVYFIILLPRSSDLVLIRPNLFSVFWLFASIPLISAIYQKYQEDIIFKEITNCAFIILVLFVINVLVSTINRYSPNDMYGITKGILYGNLYGAGFNILAIAFFIIFLKFIDSRKPIYLLILVVSYAFIMLSLRRTVMLVSTLGLVIALLALFTQKGVKKIIVLGSVIFLFGYLIYSNTGFMDLFNERYELRNLESRELEGEARFLEYGLVYKDMFVYNDYSPWVGHELLNSSGNYGKGIFELRTLHADLPSIAHSSGIIGLVLYLLMVITAFWQSFKASATNLDKLIILFCLATFVVYTITGRFTEAGSMLLLFFVLMLPLAKTESYNEERAPLAHSQSLEYSN